MVRVSETELHILDVLWERGRSTIGEITAQLYPEATTAQYATVKSLLGRLEARGCVTRDRSSFAHVFEAVLERDAFIGQQLQQMADRICGGSLKPLLINLVEGAKLKKRDRYERAIRALIQEGIDTGCFQPVDAKLATLTLLGALNWTVVWWRPDGPLTTDQLVDGLLEPILSGLRRR